MSRPLPGLAVANREVLARMVSADPVLIDCVPAEDPLGPADEFGIRIAGCGRGGFTALVETPRELLSPGFGPEDRNPDPGDSAIVETIRLGGMTLAASSAAARFVGAGGLDAAPAVTADMREIAVGEHPHFRIATDGNRGALVGIDVRRVVETGLAPILHTGIAGCQAGTGQVGAGTVRAPVGCFTAALEVLGQARGAA